MAKEDLSRYQADFSPLMRLNLNRIAERKGFTTDRQALAFALSKTSYLLQNGPDTIISATKPSGEIIFRFPLFLASIITRGLDIGERDIREDEKGARRRKQADVSEAMTRDLDIITRTQGDITGREGVKIALAITCCMVNHDDPETSLKAEKQNGEILFITPVSQY